MKVRLARSLATKALAVLLALTLTFSVAGCGTSELRQNIQTAQAITDAAAKILSASNPEVGTLLTQASGNLALLDTLVAQYEASVAAGKPGIATQIQAITSTLQGNLSQILAAVRVKNPELLEYIQVAVAIANSVVTIVISRLPAPPPEQAPLRATMQAKAQALPTVEFSSHKDLKQIWNDKVRTAYPKSKI